ncbi:MAG: glutamate 5-kinase [Pseudomonadota bacterium]|nr:glutamate 5-kinase [Pseudomonadota bacterium]
MSRILSVFQSRLLSARRIVIKVGSSLLVDGKRNEVRRPWLGGLIEDICACRDRGQEVAVVSSGAISLGRRVLKLVSGPLELEQRQAAAACGQIRMAHTWQEELARKDVTAAQVLLTPDDTEERSRYLNSRAAIRGLLSMGIVPIINENDTVTTPAHRYGDNDRLSARVATMIEADCLVLLSDIDGLYTADPTIDPGAQLIPEVRSLTPDILAMAGDSRSGFGTGGMRTKIEAARIALRGGCAMAIARGNLVNPLQALEKPGRYTWFIPDDSPVTARKKWIGGSLNPRGSLTIDDGAVRALDQGKSLLPVGIRAVTGEFSRGDSVTVLSPGRTELARGLVAYDSTEVRKIMGRQSDAVEAILGYRGREEIIHRDDLVLL